MKHYRFAQLLRSHWDEEFMSSAEIAKELRLPVETIHQWCAGEELPDDRWYIDKIGKLLQLTVAEIDHLCVAAGFEAMHGTWQPEPTPVETPPTPPQSTVLETNPPSPGGRYDFSGDFRGAILNVNCWMEGVVQITGTQKGYWTLPEMETLFFAPYSREKEILQAAQEEVWQSGRGQVVVITGQPGSGRHALVNWLAEQWPEGEENVFSARLDSPPVAASLQLLEKSRRAAPSPTLFVIENLPQDETWFNELMALAQEISRGDENLPVLLIVTITTRTPVSQMAAPDSNSLAGFAQKLTQEDLATLIELGRPRLSYQEIADAINTNDSHIAGRLYELTDGDLYWCEVIWREWVEASGVGVRQDDAGYWQAIPDESGGLAIYASVARQIAAQLANLVQRHQAKGKCPYTQAEAEAILQCAAAEGQWFTAEAVADVLGLERESLIHFLDTFLQPYEDETNPQHDLPGIVACSGKVQIDPERPDSIVTEFYFTRPYLYYAWRKHPPMKEKRAAWQKALAEALVRLYHPYEVMILEKLDWLVPGMGETYRRRQREESRLQNLRAAVYPLLDTPVGHYYASYRLFDLGIDLLQILDANRTFAFAQEGLILAKNLDARARYWRNAKFEANIAMLWGSHWQNIGAYKRALQQYQRAIRLCEQERLDELLYAASLNNLGDLLRAMGDTEGARPYFERALAIREKVLGPDHPSTAASLNNLGMLLQAMGDYEGARPYLERALAIREKVLGPEHPHTAASLNNLGGLLDSMGDYEGARPYLERALAIWEKVLGPEHPDTASSLNNLGMLLQAMGDYEGARPYLERALAIVEKVLGPDHPHTAASLNNLGLLLYNMRDYEGARPYLERALAIAEKVLGPDHPHTAASLNNLGGLLQAMGDYEGAREYLERALAIFEKVLRPEHPYTKGVRNNLQSLS